MLTSAVSFPVDADGPDVVRLQLLQEVEAGVLAAERMDDLKHHRRAVAGLAGRRILDLALELGVEQFVVGRRRRLERGGIVDEAQVIKDERLIVVGPAVNLSRRGGRELLQEALGLGALDEGGQGHENVGLRIRLLLRDALDDAAGAGLDILDLDAGRLGERIELRLEPAALAVMQAVGRVDRDDVGSRQRGRREDSGGDEESAEQRFHGFILQDLETRRAANSATVILM